MEDERDRIRNEMPISYRKHGDLWRKLIKDIFG
jgi:hypothetical protein